MTFIIFSIESEKKKRKESKTNRMLGWFLHAIIWRKCPFGEENIEESHQKIQYILQNIQKKTILFRKLPIYNKKPMSLRKGIGCCQQSDAMIG